MIRCKGVDMSIDEYCDMRQIPSDYRKIDELIKRGYIIETDFGYEEKEIFAAK